LGKAYTYLSIVQALQEGVVTRASLIVNGGAVEDAVWLARGGGLLSVLGLHLNLSEGVPVSAHVPTLTAGGLMLGKHGFREAVMLSRVSAEDLERETNAQIDKFRSLVGHFPSRIDGHQHCHVLPGVRETLSKVFASKGVQYTRIPNERAASALCRVCAVTSQEATVAKGVYSSQGILSADCLVGLSFCASSYSPQELTEAIRAQVVTTQSANCEIMVHPGHQADSPGWDAFDCSANRARELEVLCNPSLKLSLKKTTILVSEFVLNHIGSAL